MEIKEAQNTYIDQFKIVQESKEDQQKFSDILKSLDENSKISLDKSAKTDQTVEQFIDSLLDKGALTFLSELNQEKIDKLVEEYRTKLLEERGDSPEVQKQIDSLVTDFKKQLLEKLQNSLDNESSELKISTHAMLKTFMDMIESKNSPVENLLQQS